MCGICGAIGIDPQRNPEAIVRCMLAAIVQRGPDNSILTKVASECRALSFSSPLG